MTIKQIFSIFLQVIGMLVFIGAGVAGTLIYIGAQKKQATDQAAAVQAAAVNMKPEPTPVLPISKPMSNSERITHVKAKSRPAKAAKPVVYSTTKKPVAAIEKPKYVSVATKKVAPTKAQVKRLTAKAAEKNRLYYGASPETKQAMQSLIKWNVTENNVPTEVKRARFSPKIGDVVTETELEAKRRVEKEKLDAAMKQFFTTGEMQKK